VCVDEFSKTAVVNFYASNRNEASELIFNAFINYSSQ